MRKNNKPELFTKQSIESIKIYIDENDDDLQENLYDLGYNKGYTDAMNAIAGIESR